MKQVTALLLGVFLVMLLTIPGLAEPNAKSMDIYTATGGSGVTNTDPQSPPLDGSAFTNYDTVFVHGVNAIGELDNPNIYNIHFRPNGMYTEVNGKISSDYPYAVIDCPIPSYQLKTGGVQPRVRYIAVEHVSGSIIGSHAYPEVFQVSVYNGYNHVKTVSITFSHYGDDPSLQIIDLNGWYAFDRGLNIALYIQNGYPSISGFCLSGYGARFEW